VWTAGYLRLAVVNTLPRPPEDLIRDRPNPAARPPALSSALAADYAGLRELPVSVARQVMIRQLALVVLFEIHGRVEPPRQLCDRDGIALDHPGLAAVQRRVSVNCLLIYLSGWGCVLTHFLSGRSLLSCLYVGVPTGRHVRRPPQELHPIFTEAVGESGRSGSHRSESHCQHRYRVWQSVIRPPPTARTDHTHYHTATAGCGHHMRCLHTHTRDTAQADTQDTGHTSR